MSERSLWTRINDGLTRTRLVVTNLFFIGMILLLGAFRHLFYSLHIT